MRPANDPTVNYKALVQAGYDRAAAAYSAARLGAATPGLDWLMQQLSAEASVLDLGCGAGVPVAQALAQRFRVTGVDISAEQIRRARENVPGAAFIQQDVMTVELPLAAFDAAVMFYALFHLPREEHPALVRRVHGWLRPGGYLLATVTQAAEDAYTEDDFFGVTMYWSNYGLDDYRRMLTEIGFEVLDTMQIGHGYPPDHPPEVHPMILARK